MAGPRTGVGHVTAAIVKSLSTRDDVDLVAYAVTGDRAVGSALHLPPGTKLRVTGVPARALFGAWRRVPSPRIERWTGPVEVVHGTNFVVPPTRAGALVTVHDLAFVREPELVSAASRRYAGLLRASIRRGATVHVFSDTVGDDVIELLGCPRDRVVRIHPGIAETGDGDAAAGHRLAGTDRYVLALGTVEPRKNYPRLVAAFDRVAATDRGLRLVIAGDDGWGVDAFTAAVGDATHGDRVVRVGYVTDAQRCDLLAGALLLAYPSLDEGFGHPPLEAMRAGIPVVAGDSGSLPEVLGDAAVLVDPHSIDGLAAALAVALDDPALRDRLVGAGTQQVARYTWARAADELVACYHRLAGR